MKPYLEPRRLVPVASNFTQGREERESCYKPMKDALLAHFSDIPFKERCILTGSCYFPSSLILFVYRGNFRVLVPGTGLGRLAYDVASLGTSRHRSFPPNTR